MATYVVAGSKPWNRRIFDAEIASIPGTWHYVDSREELTLQWLESIRPDHVFFLHWSWKVETAIIEQFDCVCFHMTDVPYGRGGSPLQNLIARGHRATKLTALKMVRELDAGPVYYKEDLSLEGGAEEIYIRATRQAAAMMRRIGEENIRPEPQQGEVEIFKRRSPQQSEIEALADLDSLHDFVRMLDAEGYPKAFLIHEGFRYEFSRAVLYDGRIQADVAITPIEKGDR